MLEFIIEAEDHLNAVEALLLKNSGKFSLPDVDTLFRAVHSIKGASSYFNLIEINKTSQALENLLDEVRDGKCKMEEELKQLTLRYIDLQRKLMKSAKSVMQNERELIYDDASREFLFQLYAYREQKKS
ncbi:MAG: Hpt domain-containing protein [Deltaproteobacteria bacterium]|nr:Hpt domain-containing protein [Deltaproteobacteria bacterium]